MGTYVIKMVHDLVHHGTILLCSTFLKGRSLELLQHRRNTAGSLIDRTYYSR